jgi:tetratricopeptide (TPR) repeat protein
MKAKALIHNCIVAALFPIFIGAGPVLAQTAAIDQMFQDLAVADERAAGRIERRIWREWSKSGSAPMDLLLDRGREAMMAGDTKTAVEHFTALVDHAPDFAEGWNARATAYFQMGAFGPAVADIRRVLALNPRHFGAMLGFARILEETDRPDQALKVYEAALAIHPHLKGVSEAAERLREQATGQEM